MFSHLRPALARVRQLSSQIAGGPSPSTPSSASSAGGMNKGVVGAVGAVGLAAAAYYWNCVSSTSSPAASISTSSSPSTTPVMDPSVYTPYTLRQVVPVNHNTALYRFALPRADQILGLPTCSFVFTKYTPAGSDKPVERPYTPTSPDTAQGYFDLLVKTYPTGSMSRHLASLKPGDTLDIRGPIVKYQLDTPNQHSHIGLIAGGTGITPMLQILNKVTQLPGDNTKVTLVFANISERDILLKDHLDRLTSQHPDRIKVVYTLDQPADRAKWSGEVGRVDSALVRKYMPPPTQDNIKIFICGPPPMVKSIAGPKAPDYSQGDLAGVLRDLGYTNDQVFKF